MADIGGLISATLGGGAAGILGQIINRGFAIFETAQKRKDTLLANQQEEKRWANERGLLEIQMKQEAEAHERDIETAGVSGSWEGLRESLQAEASIGGSYPWVNAVRALVRPVLTFGSHIGVMVVFFTASASVKATVQQQVVETVLFIATAATLWWFGERAEHKARGGK